ncbi:MAG: HD domain-containing protein [Deltaproteobacteria bacterium]|nr:HD domain-containing protein [Deltaproteobacteria bacterium]
MNPEDLERLKAWFSGYVHGFYKRDPDYNLPIRLKEDHTRRVCRNMTDLGKALGVSNHDLVLAETMALFHDVGRFKQYADHGTFNDRISVNHAKLGIRQLATRGILSVLTRDERRLITKAIAYHNAPILPTEEDEETLFYARLLRDADKLDIWKVFVDYYQERKTKPNIVVEIGLPDEPVCSQKILDALHKKSFARMQDLKTLNDFKLLQISWVFDLNFGPSFQIVQERAYIDKIEATLPDSEDVMTAVDRARDHVKHHLPSAAVEN